MLRDARNTAFKAISKPVRRVPFDCPRSLRPTGYAPIACHAITSATAEPAAGSPTLHLPGSAFYGEAGLMRRTRDSETLLFTMLRDAKNPAFKAVSKLVR